jgi:hypothetical protein
MKHCMDRKRTLSYGSSTNFYRQSFCKADNRQQQELLGVNKDVDIGSEQMEGYDQPLAGLSASKREALDGTIPH